jgi:hypothetical protein
MNGQLIKPLSFETINLRATKHRQTANFNLHVSTEETNRLTITLYNSVIVLFSYIMKTKERQCSAANRKIEK